MSLVLTSVSAALCMLTVLIRELHLPRVSKIFDAVAKLCISQPKGEVIALTLQTLPSGVAMVVAGNSDIPEATRLYLHEMWDVLQQLSRDYAKIHGELNLTHSRNRPKFHSLEHLVQQRVQKLGRTILQFTMPKYRNSVNKHYEQFAQIGQSKAREMGFEGIYLGITVIHKYMNTTLLGPESESHKHWDAFWTVLDAVRSAVDKFNRDPSELSKTFHFNFTRYITRVAEIPRHIGTLLDAANSPRLRGIFQAEFSVVALKSSGKVYHTLPRSSGDWQRLIDIILDYRNQERDPHEQSYKINPQTVQDDAKWLDKYLLNPLAFVHCEAALIAYILAHPDDNFYNYIGVSKLCCRGCYALVQAINKIFGNNFVVRGCHHKFYYPWKFPQIPQHHVVAQSMLASLCYRLGHTYQGFRPATQQYFFDSEAASTSKETSSDFEDEGFRLIKEVTQGKTQFEFASTYC